MGTAATIVPLVIAAASAGATAYNTRRTERRQDAQLAQGIRRQGQKQSEADAAVAAQVKGLQESTSLDEEGKRRADYAAALRRNKKGIEGGLATPGAIGSQTFQQGQQAGKEGARTYGMNQGDLMARMDAPSLQRMGEGFNRGMLSTDLGLISREATGQSYIDQLRLRAIQRDPYIDALADVAAGYAGGRMGKTPAATPSMGAAGGDYAYSAAPRGVPNIGSRFWSPGPGI